MLRLWHNEECAKLVSEKIELWRKRNFYPQLHMTMLERNNQISVAKAGLFWNPEVPDHVSGGVIKYPANLDQENEGSRAVFLFGLEAKLGNRERGNIDLLSIETAILQVKEDAANGSFWNPTIGVIS